MTTPTPYAAEQARRWELCRQALIREIKRGDALERELEKARERIAELEGEDVADDELGGF